MVYKNCSLFADNYLKHHLPNLEEWKQDKDLQTVYSQIRQLYFEKQERVQSANEAQLEHELIRPLLTILWGQNCYLVQPELRTGGVVVRPDYALFGTALQRERAGTETSNLEFWHQVSAIAEVKTWESSLDRRQGTHENPSAQICNYLYRTGVRWGILTNGRLWRLYEREISRTGGVYYEVDLLELIRENNPEAFRYFVHFFRRDAFVPDTEGLSFVDRVLKGSQEYAVQVGERLRENVYDALRTLMDGFLQFPTNGLSANDANTLQKVYNNSLIVLYRLLFLLYAEDRRLLPVDDKVYRDYSLQKLHREINGALRAGRRYYPKETRFWNALLALTRIIDEGLPDNGTFVLPPYNGGLFRPDAYPEVSHTPLPNHQRWEIGDAYLAEVIDLLAYERERYDQPGIREIDYSSLDVQHLGSIYEGLLELKPKIATKTLYERASNGRSVFEESIPNNTNLRRIEAGRVYLTTDRGERKATGSYYTPKPVVNFIVEQTLSSILDSVAQEVAKRRPEVEDHIRKLESQCTQEIQNANPERREDIKRKYEEKIEQQKMYLLEPYLSIKVLDPAMGSGHFLVGAADYISMRMANDSNLLPLRASESEDTQTYYKRLIVERCLYGVDLNSLAVELAKLSLWLHTVSRGRALSFLDHHLRCGNTLLGAWIEQDLSHEPPQLNKNGRRRNHSSGQLTLGFTETLTSQHLSYFLDTFRQISEAPTGDAEIERQKVGWYRDLEKIRKKFRAVANCWLAPYFGVPVSDEHYAQAIEALRDSNQWEAVCQEEWFQKAQAIAQEYRFFHWELEFPEVFFNSNGLKKPEQRGFDAVIGNPPYLFGEYIPEEIGKIATRYEFASGQYDVYWLFYEVVGKHLLKQNGMHGYIVPDPILMRDETEKLRRWLTENYRLTSLAHSGLVFLGVNVSTAIVVWQKCSPDPSNLVSIAKFENGNFITQEPRNQSDFVRTPKVRWILLLDKESQKILTKILNQTCQLKVYVKVSRGEEEGKKKLPIVKSGSAEPIIVGEDVKPYYPLSPTRFIETKLIKKDRSQYRAPKVVLVKTGESPSATVDTKGYVTLQSVYNIHIKAGAPLSVYTLCALLNSRLMRFLISLLFTQQKGQFPQLNQSMVEELPVPNYQRTTEKIELDGLLEEARKIYTTLLKNEQSFPQTYEEFVPSALGQWLRQRRDSKQTDVIHDFLGFLAEQLIQLNERKQAEVQEFHQWLGDLLGAKMEDLPKKKNLLRKYYEMNLSNFIEVLGENRPSLRVDPYERQYYERIRKEFERSVQILQPILSQMAKTERLIDWVVYFLYKLDFQEVLHIESAGA